MVRPEIVCVSETLATDCDGPKVNPVGKTTEETNLYTRVRIIAFEEDSVDRIIAIGSERLDPDGFGQLAALEGSTDGNERRQGIVDDSAEM